MIPVNRADVLEAGLELLSEFREKTSIAGRFVALYLGLRRMGDQMSSLDSEAATSSKEIEAFLDALFTKVHRPEPFVVLTALFGGSPSSTAPYSGRSGTKAPGRKFPINNWRNNFRIQKGVGCPADSATIKAVLNDPAGRLSCPHMSEDPEGRHICGIEGANYRGEEHSVWLHVTAGGYQKVDLDHPSVYRNYLNPSERKIPIFPLITALYALAPETAYPTRAVVGIPDFAEDFRFSLDQVQALFDCEPATAENARLLARLETSAWVNNHLLQAPQQPVAGSGAGEPQSPALPIPPPATQINFGIASELVVARELVAHGWKVFYKGNQQLLGYDLEAFRGEEILRIEVKSSVAFTYPELRESEWKAAQQYGESFVLAVVDFVGSEKQTVWYVRNPAGASDPVERSEVTFCFPRIELVHLRTEAEFL